MRRAIATIVVFTATVAFADGPLVPTGKHLDAVGASIALGNMPLTMVRSPEGTHLLVLLSGWRMQGVQVIDLASKAVVQTVPLNSAFLGIAFSPDGSIVYISGANDDIVHVFAWRDARLTPLRTISLQRDAKEPAGSRYPSGIAVSSDGRRLYVVENVADSLAVVDAASGRVVQRFHTDRYPYGVVVDGKGSVYVSAWGAGTISVFRQLSGELVSDGTIAVGRHPSTLMLDRAGEKLYATLASVDRVAVVDPNRKRVLGYLDDSSPAGPREGSTPNAVALSADEKLLYVAEADNNAVAIFRLADRALIGRIPVDWYPTAVIADAKTLFVLNGKGAGSRPNPQGRTPAEKLQPGEPKYVLALIEGSLRIVDLPPSKDWTQRVARANNWTGARPKSTYPPFKHAVYIIKENRTYDQVFGDMPEGDNDPSLIFFPRAVSPNHHALAARFGLFDRFFTNAEVSSQGHMWSTAGYVTDYIEKAVQSLYADKRPDENEEVEDPAEGYLWTRAAEQGIRMRNYGEFANIDDATKTYEGIKPGLTKFTSPKYPSYNLEIRDQVRADAWIEEFNEYVRTKSFPTLEIMHLPGDHTAGGRAGRRTPRAYMADNDLALARIISAISKSPYWRDTAIFVLEDDAQDGADHVDMHRSVLLVISAWNRGGVYHRFVNTTDVLATVEQIAGMRPMSQFDYFSRPLADVFGSKPDLRPYEPIVPEVAMDEMNAANAPAAKPSASIDLSRPDAVPDDLFNRILWLAIKGDTPYPETRRATPAELMPEK